MRRLDAARPIDWMAMAVGLDPLTASTIDW